MPSPPTASIIIPCYNQGQYLGAALLSARAQTFEDVEIIVVDDGSDDPESLEALEALEDQIDILIRTDNFGVVNARNTAIDAASGRYILPLDADDLIEPGYLEQAIDALENDPHLGIVYCHADYFGEKQGPWKLPPYRFPEILVGNMIFNSGVFRRDDWAEVGGYNPNMQYGWEDYDFWIAIISLGREVLQLSDTLFHYRILPGSRNSALGDKGSNMVQAHVQIFHNHRDLYEQHIEVLFSTLVRLWRHAARSQQDSENAQQELAALRQQLAELQANSSAAAPEVSANTPAPGLLGKLAALFRA